ncbi:AraC family transcriptional regulator [Paludibacteraceae bacterium OttesenSCG-928-F17]|nr:AraC family transcriptional regulator [Paludibacteraceae bacterium OttesenSCG-928-F17]
MNYFNKEREGLAVEFVRKDKGDVYEFVPVQNAVCFVESGDVYFSSGMYNKKLLKEGTMFMHPGRYKAIFEFESPSAITIMYINVDNSFYDSLSVKKLYDKDMEEIVPDLYSLEINKTVERFLLSLEDYMKDGMFSTTFLELKSIELMYILQSCHSRRDLQLFFHVVQSKDKDFTEKIFEDVKTAKSVKDLAALSHYSLSGFEKKFKKIFGMSASKWLEQEKAREIYHRINTSNKTIMEIGYEFGFTPSHFNNYCKRIFKKTPNQLRKEANNKV